MGSKPMAPISMNFSPVNISSILLISLTAISVILCALVPFLDSQSAGGARKLLKYIDQDLGEPLPEMSYGEDCRLYTPGHPKGSFYTFWVSGILFCPHLNEYK